MENELDLIVIGTGAAARTVANQCRRSGWSVAVVDERPYGGTCVLRGCDPKRVLAGVAEVFDTARRLTGHGIQGEVRLDWSALSRFERSFTAGVPDQREHAFEAAGITTLHGRARFVGPRTLSVGDREITARRIHIAAGAEPAPLSIEGTHLLTTSDQFLSLEELPRRMVFLGGGYISFELAHVARAAGAKVTILEMAPRPLGRFDPDQVDLLVERSRAMGIDVLTDTVAASIEEGGDGMVVWGRRRDQRLEIHTDMVIHGAGRVPSIGDLDLGRGGVEHDRSGIVVNEYMQSVSNEAVYAAGDVVRGSPQLTPVASLEARVAAANLLEGNHRPVNYPPIPSVVFTLPALASVGLREDEARERGLSFDVRTARTSDWYSSRRIRETTSAHKILVEQGSGKILGAHLIGSDAGEIINLFAAAMGWGLRARDLRSALFTYPSRASDAQDML